MKQNLVRALGFTLCVTLLLAAYCLLAPVASRKYNGISTADQIKASFAHAVSDDYTCYFLGNSRIYRGINPDMFPSVKSYNFAHDNDCYNQMYYKLLYLLQHKKKIDTLILGTDYNQFSYLSDTRNYVYSSFFPAEYLNDFEETSIFQHRLDHFAALWETKRIAFPSCIKFLLCRPAPRIINYQKDNGQYIVDGLANGKETIDRNYAILDVQYDYFMKIIDLCQKESIDLFIIMPPLWEAELATHTDAERDTFNEMIEQALEQTPYRDHYINYSLENGLLPYTDFIDVTHLTPSAADVFSTYINSKVFSSRS